MRLIDADAFRDWLLNRFAKPQDTLVLTLQGFIAEQPTAYDIGKVVEKLEKLADESYKEYRIDFYSDDRAKYDAYTNAIEIVNKGGVGEDVCEWHCDEYGRWNTECYELADSDPLEYTYCPYCGKKIKVVE